VIRDRRRRRNVDESSTSAKLNVDESSTSAKLEALERLKSYVTNKNIELGVDTDYSCATPLGSTYGAKINDPDTWSGPLADEAASETTTDVEALVSAFAALSDAIDEAIRSEQNRIAWSDVGTSGATIGATVGTAVGPQMGAYWQG